MDLSQKKPFDKKKWRQQKYSKKFKIEQWEERKRKAALRKYHKEMRKSDPDFRTDKTSEETSHKNDSVAHLRKRTAYESAQLEYEKKREEKRCKREEALKKKVEREEALQQYRTNKMEKYKKLSKKTRKGQPVMSDRIQMLLEKLQKET